MLNVLGLFTSELHIWIHDGGQMFSDDTTLYPSGMYLADGDTVVMLDGSPVYLGV